MTNPISEYALSVMEGQSRDLAIKMRSSSYTPLWPIPFTATEPFPVTYGSALLERFLGKTGRSLSPTEFQRANGLPAYQQQLNFIESNEARRLTLDKSKRTIDNLKLRNLSQDPINKPDIEVVPAYQYDTLYSHVHYGPNINSATHKGLSKLVQASDEYLSARTYFQNRLIRHVNFLGSLYDSVATEEGRGNSPGTTPIKIVPGKSGNKFSISNGPFFTAPNLSYSIQDSRDRNSEDRDLFFTFGELERGLGQIKDVTYYNIGDKVLYFANVSFFWWDNFTFDNKDALNLIPDIGNLRRLQQYGFAEPFTTSIRIDDTIAGFVAPSDATYISQPETKIQQGGFGNDYLPGSTGNDVLLGRFGNDTLVGLAGDDLFSGGQGADRFVLNAPNQGFDQIVDFSSQERDKLIISASAFGGGLRSDNFLSVSQLRVAADASQATESTHRFIFDTNSGLLWFDGDGTGSIFKPTPLAMLANTTSIGVLDFIVSV
jgi:hypothetical protein